MTEIVAEPDQDGAFAGFFREVEPRLRHGLVAALGLEGGQDATANAMVYAWRHWDRVRTLDNPAGYLYRVGCRSLPRRLRPRPEFPPVDGEAPWVEPGLPAALRRLSRMQRTVVVLRHGFQWTHTEIAALLGVARSTVETHEQRALHRLRHELGVRP